MNSVIFSAFKGNRNKKLGNQTNDDIQQTARLNGISTCKPTTDEIDDDTIKLPPQNHVHKHPKPILKTHHHNTNIKTEENSPISYDEVDNIRPPTNSLDSPLNRLGVVTDLQTSSDAAFYVRSTSSNSSTCSSNSQEQQNCDNYLQQQNADYLKISTDSNNASRCSSSCSSNSSNTSSCDVTTIAASGSTSQITTPAPRNHKMEPITTAPIPASPISILSQNHTQPIIMGGSNGTRSCSGSMTGVNGSSVTATSSAATTPKTSRYSKPRLSLSGFSNNFMPSVHGRSNGGNTSNGQANINGQPKRLSTHQRNLSLDFRSMGILLPPVSQVTNSRINLTQHHRNRSLDSALQRIPEVEVSSPNAETTDTTFCTNSILGSTMCSKIVTSSSSPSAVCSAIATSSSSLPPPPSSLTSNSDSTTVDNPTSTATFKNPQNTPAPCSIRNNSIAIDTCCRPNSTANCMTEKTSTQSVVKISEHSNINCNNHSIKKREDLTSLGSDDSGIICGSESDQVSLNRIRQSHESLDSGEMDPEEECIEILETTSMDEEYRMLQSDLCFYQTPEKDLRSRPRRKTSDQSSEDDQQTLSATEISGPSSRDQSNVKQKLPQKPTIIIDKSRICVPIDIDVTPTAAEPSADSITPTEESLTKNLDIAQSGVKIPETAKPENINKNDLLFKNFNFFGATKNAIFRTAQSIIENHEKKNSAKNKSEDGAASSDIKSPTEILKKKEFFVLKGCSSKNKIGQITPNTLVPAVNTPDTPVSAVIPLAEIEVKPLSKSASGTSLNRIKVPGVVKCFIRDRGDCRDPPKIEKGPSGLLRFFESPVFNIHFAVHYLFYSKEPGVLSFIGNKIFSFPDQEVDLYIPQLIVMYIQMDELAEVLDPYLTLRCRKSVDFSLKCLWLLEAYNYQVDSLSSASSSATTATTATTGTVTGKKTHLSLMKELYPKKKERKQTLTKPSIESEILSPIKKTHHRSQSDATGLLNDSLRFPSSGALSLTAKMYPTATPAKLCLGDLASGRAFDNGCICFESVRGTVNDLRGHKTVCLCGAPKTAPQKEFMLALIDIGKKLTSPQTKAEKTSALRMFLNLINKNLPARVWLPLHSDIPHHIVRITEEKTAVLNSKDKTPYIIYVEVVEVSDTYSSPVIMKMMPTLRHTKSEEHLETAKEKVSATASNPRNAVSSMNSHSSSNLSTKDSGADCAGSKDSKNSESSSASDKGKDELNALHFTEDDVWSQEDDEITAQYLHMHKICERDAISQMSLDSCDSRDQGIPTLFNIGDVRTRHCINLNCENTKPFSNDPEDPSAAALKEPWHEKERQIRDSSPYGHLSNWRLLSAIVKCGDDLRQELMATQLLQMFKLIWQEENVDLWVRPYKIVCLSNDSGLIEPILNTVSLHQIKKNSSKSLRDYFIDEYGEPECAKFKQAQKNFVQSCAAYCLISYLLQVKDRHNGNILVHADGHLIHIDFGFILSISPKNLGFEQSPFKLTPEFVDVMGGTTSELWIDFNHSLLKGLMAARKHMDRIINLVEIMRSNAQLPCFKNGYSGTVQNLRKRFHMNLTEQELERKVEQLVQDSLKSLSTKLYDGYQYFTNGIL